MAEGECLQRELAEGQFWGLNEVVEVAPVDFLRGLEGDWAEEEEEAAIVMVVERRWWRMLVKNGWKKWGKWFRCLFFSLPFG